MASNLLGRQVEKEWLTEEAVIPQAIVPDEYNTGILFLMSDDTETSFDVKEKQVEEKCGTDGKAEEDEGRMEENDNQGNDSRDSDGWSPASVLRPIPSPDHR